jgi:transcription elongation factor GreA
MKKQYRLTQTGVNELKEELESLMQNVQVIKPPKSNGQVRLGSTVQLKGTTGKSQQFQIVGTMEADPMNGKISDESPIGKELLGKKEGDQAFIKTPSETAAYRIVSIS